MKPTKKLQPIKQIKSFFVLTLFAVLAVLVMSSTSWAATYYVDATNGNDNKDGLSPSTAWKAIAKVNNSKFNPGNQILFKRGEVWREQLVVSSSGSAANSIAFRAYGEGNDPIISGANKITTDSYQWMISGSGTNEYYLEATGGGDPGIDKPPALWLDGNFLNIGIAGSLIDHQWAWGNNDSLSFNTIYLRDDSGDPEETGVQIEAAQREAAIYVSFANYIIIDGFELKGGGKTSANIGEGIAIYNTSSNITIRNCTLHHNWKHGIIVNNSTNIIIEDCVARDNHVYAGISFWNSPAANVEAVVRRCKLYNNYENGILVENSNNVAIEECQIYQNGDENIDIYNSKNVKITYSTIYGAGRVHNLDGNGVMVANNSNSFLIEYSILYNNPAFGVAVWGSEGAILYNCTFYKNNLAVNAQDDNFTMKNCILAESGWGQEIQLDSGLSGTDIDYNCYYRAAVTKWRLGSIIFSSLVDWQSSSGQDSNSMVSDPLFNETSKDNFTLQRNSPCLNHGTDVDLIRDYVGTSIPQGQGVDIGAFEYQFLSPPKNLRQIK